MREKLGYLFGLLYLVGALFVLTPNLGHAAEIKEPETCAKCHEDTVANYEKSHHKEAWANKPEFAKKACTSCHGDAEKHVESEGGTPITNVFRGKDLDATKLNASCLKCHSKSEKLAFWNAGKHGKNGVTCASCHSPHSADSKKPLKPSVDKCFTCHKDVQHDVQKLSHHPIIEGKVSCADCHNPHGTLNHGMLQTETTNQLCYRCHTDKRGPMLWEHPVVDENCLSCHSLHGSRNAKLLIEKVPNLCMTCHDFSRHPGTPYDAKGGFGATAANLKPHMIGRGCVNCHAKIHGSFGPANPANGYSSSKFFVR